MTAKARLHEAVSNAFAMKGGGSVALIVASTLVLATVGNSLAAVVGPLGQCALYRFGWTKAADPGGAFRGAMEQLVLPLVMLVLLVGVLYWNGRRNARGMELQFKPPRPHLGLVAMLSQFPGQRKGRFATLDEAVAALETEPVEPVRDALMDSTLGPLIAAVEHHRSTLRRCWIVVSEKGTEGLYSAAAKILERIAPGCAFAPVLLGNAFDIRLMTEVVATVYRNAEHDNDIGGDLIADITGGTAAMSAGMVLATLNDDRDVEYLRQDYRLVDDGRALSREEILDRKILMSVSTSPALVRSVFAVKE